MPNNVVFTEIFEKYFKRYSKKHRSLKTDLDELVNKLIENPKLGTELGNNLYKIRLAVKSKNKGKSGGFRVITYLITENADNIEINLIIIYDKSEISDMPKKDLIEILKQIFD